MKAERFVLFVFLVLSTSLAFISGCKNSVSTPLWDQPYKTPATPSITSVSPSPEAKPGINTITISGHNFLIASLDTLVPENVVVYFNTLQSTMVSVDSTTIVVRRPNLVSDSCTIKIVAHNAVVEPTFSPYKIDAVMENYGGFLQNLQLASIGVDNQDHVYVTDNSTSSSTTFLHVLEATSATDNVELSGTVSAGATQFKWRGACVGPDGFLYVLGAGNRGVDKANLLTGAVTQKWVQLPKPTNVGDFGPGGYLFTGGAKTDLYVVSPFASGSLNASQLGLSGAYASDTILAVKVYNGYVYVASKPSASSNPAKIWRNQLTSDSTIGTQELVIDMSGTAFAADPISAIAFSSSGGLFIATNSVDPIIWLDPSTGRLDNFYKGIVPSYCSGIAWSKASNYLYMISGNTATSQTWTVNRIDMGDKCGANF